MRRCGTHSCDPAEKVLDSAAGARRNGFAQSKRQLALCLLLPIALGCVTKGTYDEVARETEPRGGKYHQAAKTSNPNAVYAAVNTQVGAS